MARGNQKQSKNSLREAPLTAGGKPVKEMSIEDFTGWYLQNSTKSDNGKETYGELINKFSLALNNYTSTLQLDRSWKQGKGHKERKQEVIDLYLKLPAQVRAQMEVGDDKFVMSQLRRGAPHASHKMPNGTIAASFSPNPDVYNQFANGDYYQFGNKTPKENYIYRMSDIKSFEGAIDFDRFRNVVMSIDAANNSDSVPKGFKQHQLYPNNIDEEEVMIYGIKWKDNVDTKEWKKNRTVIPE